MSVTVNGNQVRRYDGKLLQESDPHVLVHAQRTSCINGSKEEIVVAFERVDKTVESGRRILLNLCNGITGYESWVVDKQFLQEVADNGLLACSGTPMRYDELYISSVEMRQLIEALELSI